MSSKGASASQRCAACQRALLLFATFQNLQFCPKCFRKDYFINNILIEGELSFTDDETENRTVDSSRRDHTLIFVKPKIGHFYFALKLETFSRVAYW